MSNPSSRLKRECSILVDYLGTLLVLADLAKCRIDLFANIVKAHNIDLRTEHGIRQLEDSIENQFGTKSAIIPDMSRELYYLLFGPKEILYCLMYEVFVRYEKTVLEFPETEVKGFSAHVRANKTYVSTVVKTIRNDIAHPERDYPIATKYLGNIDDRLDRTIVEGLNLLRDVRKHLRDYV